MAANDTLPETKATLHDVLQDDAAKNRVPVHTFNPDASPAQKGVAAGKGKDQLNSVKTDTPAEMGIAVDTGNSTVVPTITIEDVDKVAHASGHTNGNANGHTPPSPTGSTTSQQSSPDVPTPPGAIPTAPAPVIPDWYKVGWRAVADIDTPAMTEGEERDKTILEMFLNEQLYGDWYHNAALIVVTVFVSHFLTRFHFGWGWLFLLLAFCNTYYTTSMRRVRTRARDDIQRELVKTHLASEHESADWINQFLDRFWLIYEPVLAQTIVASVDQVLSTNCPPFLDSLRLSTFTLGTKAPRIDKVRTFPKTPDDIVMMDWGLSFTPNDVSDLTPRQAASKVNPKIVLSVRVGKGLASAAMPVLLEDMSFSGLLRVRMKLMTAFPHVQIVDLSFMEKPVIDYVLKPIGGETFGFDVANIPGLSSFIRDMVHSILGPMMYDPNVFTLNLEQLLSGAPLDTAIGVLQVTVVSARSIKGVKIGGGSPDPFVTISINSRAELARTKYKHNTTNPTWMETKFILINNLTESLVFELWDFNDHRKNSVLGYASFELQKLMEDATLEGIEAPVLKDGKDRGVLRFDMSFYPVLKPEQQEVPDTKVGIVRLTLHQAKDLDHTKSMTGDLNPLCKVHLGNSRDPVHITTRMKHTNNPVWESSVEFLCSDKSTSVITVRVIDDRDFLKDPVIGYMGIRLEDLLDPETKEKARDWWPLSGCKSGKLRMSAEWKPLDMAGSLHGADQYVPPIGVVRLWLQKATDVKNVEAALGGKSDPYVRVQINNVTEGRTEVVNNNLNPEWDQIIYIPVHSLKEAMMLECMDYQHLTKDRSLGYVELKVSDLAQSASEGERLYTSLGKKAVAEPLRLDKGTYKGQLHYEAEFVPALPVKGIQFTAGPNEIERAVHDGAGEGGDAYSARSSSSSEDGQDAHFGVTTTVQPLPNGGKENPLKEDKPPLSPTSNAAAVRSETGSDHDPDGKVTESPKAEGKQLEEESHEMSREELLRYQSGVIVCNVISGELQKKARLEVLLDDAYWPAFSTIRPRSRHAQWEYIGEGFIKELDFGRVWLRLNEADEGDKDDIIAEWKGDAKIFLEQTLDGPGTFTLQDKRGEDKTSIVVLEARYLPVPIKLEPRESINNMGTLNVDLLEGLDIHAADRGGKSDPFAVFTLNGQRVFKSQTIKKTLNPQWNENFIVQVPSRVGADFTVELFDWNQIEQAKSLGAGKIELADVEPFQGTEREIILTSPKHGEKGRVRIRLMFQPEIIVKTRKNTSTFSSAGRAMTQIGHLPVGAGKGVVHGVTGVFKKSKVKDFGDSDSEGPTIAELPAGQASLPVGASTRSTDTLGLSPGGTNGYSQESGTLRVTVLDAKDMSTSEIKPYVVVRVGDKESKTKYSSKTAAPEWNESFSFSAGPLTQPKLHAWVYDHKTLGKDKLLGSAEIDIWRHISPGGSGQSSADILAELREGQGLLRMRFEFDSSPLRRSMSSGDRPNSSPSASRFSISRR